MSNPMSKNELPAGSKLSRLKAQFQQKQMQDKEHKLLQMLDSQQKVAMQKAAINGVLPSKFSNNAYTNNGSANSYVNYPTAPGKVRQMFEERRKGGGVGLPSNNLYSSNGNGTPNGTQRNVIGIDKSYPLDPLVTPNNGPSSKNRSLSSKSDPNPSTYARNARNVASNNNSNHPTSISSNGRLPNTNTNNGAPRRGISLERNNPGSDRDRSTPNQMSGSRSRESSSPFTTNGQPPIGFNASTRRASSGLSGSNMRYDDDHSNSNHHQAFNNSRPLLSNPSSNNNNSTTTKYSELYHQPQGRSTPSRDDQRLDTSDSLLAKREKNLAMKMKNMQINNQPSSPESKSYGPSRSSSPPKRTAPPPRPKVSSPSVKPVAVRKTASKPEPARRSTPPPGLETCRFCGRFFAPDRLEKHEGVCKKTSNRKRKVFDPTKMRMQGTEAEPYIRSVSAKLKSPAKASPVIAASTKKADWRKKHEDFIKTIRAAKEYQAHIAAGGTASNFTGTVAPESDYSDYIQCPHCNRKFAQAAAERHIPKCQSIRSNKR